MSPGFAGSGTLHAGFLEAASGLKLSSTYGRIAMGLFPVVPRPLSPNNKGSSNEPYELLWDFGR